MANSLITNTVSEVLEQVSDLRGESSTNTDAIRIRAVSNAEQTFAKRRFWSCHLLKDQTTTGVASQNAYSIGSATYPMRLRGLVEVFVGGTLESQRMNLVTFSEYKLLYNSNNSMKLVYEYYDQANDAWYMYINPAPSTGDTIYYSHYYMPPIRTATSDTVVCPDMDAIVYGALAYIYEGEEETNKMIEAANRQELIFLELEELENTTNKGQAVVMSSGYNLIGTKGFGSY
jgi:hypothetical protein